MGHSGVTDWDPTESALRVSESERKCLLKIVAALLARTGGAIVLTDAEMQSISEPVVIDAYEEPNGDVHLALQSHSASDSASS